MEIAALCPRYPLDHCMLTTLDARGIHLQPHREFAAMMATLRARRFDAVLVEEDTQQLSYWLSAMRMHIGARAPVVVLGLGQVDGIARAFQHGADDYASIGDGVNAAIGRAQARVQRFSQDDARASLRAEGYELDPDTQMLSNGQTEVRLTAREFALARTLFENRGRVVSLNLLSTRVWGRSSDIGKRTIEQHVYKLRNKLWTVRGDQPGSAGATATVQTIYGVGYRLQLDRTFAPLQ